MTAFLWWLGENAVCATLLAVVVCAACSLLRNRPAVQHALWLVVLIKLITPPVVIWPWSVQSLAASLSLGLKVEEKQPTAISDPSHDESDSSPSPETGASHELHVFPEPPPGAVGAGPALDAVDAEILERLAALAHARESESAVSRDVDDLLPAGRPRVVADEPSVDPTQESVFKPAEATARSITERLRLDLVPPLMFAAWILGGLVAGVVQWRRIGRHWRLLRRATAPPAHLTTEVRRLSEAMGVRPVPALVARGIASPFVWCVGWLRLLWPEQLAGQADVARCRGVIAHELAHVRRRDHWVAWLELLAGAVWWWNPLFWYVRRRLRETAEIACDALALSVLPDGRRQYAEAFLELSSIGKTVAPLPVLGVSTGARQTFERRLAMILSESVVCKMSLRGLLAVGMLAIVTLPSWSLGQASSPDGQGSASVSSDETAGPATQPAAIELSNQNPGDQATQTPATRLHQSKSAVDRLELLNAVGRALDAERAARAKIDRTRIVYDRRSLDENPLIEKLQQVRKDFRTMRAGGKLDADRVAEAQRLLAEFRHYQQALLRAAPDAMIGEVFLHVLQRAPTTAETATYLKQLEGSAAPDSRVYDDVLWALINSSEFLQIPVARASDNSTPVASESVRSKVQADKIDTRPYLVGGVVRDIDRESGRITISIGSKHGLPESGTLELYRHQPNPGPLGKIEILEVATDHAVISPIAAMFGKFRQGDAVSVTIMTDKPYRPLAESAATATSPQSEIKPTFGELQSGKQFLRDAAKRPSQPHETAAKGRSPSGAFPSATSHDGKILAVADKDGEVLLVEWQTGQSLGRIQLGESARVVGLVFASDNKLLRLSSDHGVVWEVDASTGKVLSRSEPGQGQQPGGLQGSGGGIGGAERRGIDLVQLGTQLIDARREVRLAETQHSQVQKAVRAGFSPQEAETAEITLESARNKLELLTRIGQAALDAAKSELVTAKHRAEKLREQYEHGVVSQSQAISALADVTAAEAKLKLIETVLSPSSAAGSSATQGQSSPQKPDPDGVRPNQGSKKPDPDGTGQRLQPGGLKGSSGGMRGAGSSSAAADLNSPLLLANLDTADGRGVVVIRKHDGGYRVLAIDWAGGNLVWTTDLSTSSLGTSLGPEDTVKWRLVNTPDYKLLQAQIAGSESGLVYDIDAATGNLLNKSDGDRLISAADQAPVQLSPSQIAKLASALRGQGKEVEANALAPVSNVLDEERAANARVQRSQIIPQPAFRSDQIIPQPTFRSDQIIPQPTFRPEQAAPVGRPETGAAALPENARWFHDQSRTKSSTNPNATRDADASQVDLVNLGTQTIEARGAVRLAESRYDRLQRAGAAISQEDIETAMINLETARRKLEVLTSLAESAQNTAKAEIAAAKERAEYSRKMFEKGYVTQSQAVEAAAQVIAAEAKLKLVESILSPSSSAGSSGGGTKPGGRKPGIEGAIIRELPLRYANATEVVAAIEKLFGPSGGDSGSKFTANVRTNAIFVVGDEDSIAAITELVRRLDVPSEKEPPPSPSKK